LFVFFGTYICIYIYKYILIQMIYTYIYI
jgi:hypothetical protein